MTASDIEDEARPMKVMVHERVVRLRGSNGVTYDRVRIYAQPQDDVSWVGWIEFLPADAAGPVMRTERETTQSHADAVAYWATGLEPVYLEGALERAERLARSGTAAAS
jgi:hypothetical protein